MQFQIITLQSDYSFGYHSSGLPSLSEAEMAKNSHVEIRSPFVKGYMIVGSDGSIRNYDSQGRHMGYTPSAFETSTRSNTTSAYRDGAKK